MCIRNARLRIEEIRHFLLRHKPNVLQFGFDVLCGVNEFECIVRSGNVPAVVAAVKELENIRGNITVSGAMRGPKFRIDDRAML